MKTRECEYQNVRLGRLTRFYQDTKYFTVLRKVLTLLVLSPILNNIEYCQGLEYEPNYIYAEATVRMHRRNMPNET